MLGLSRSLRSPLAWLVAAGVVFALAVFALTVSASKPAEAAKAGTCESFRVTTAPGQTFRGDQKRTIPAGQVGDTIRVRGNYIRFAVDSDTFAVRNYTHTGADSPRPDKNLPIDGPTVIFERKVPLHGETLNGPVRTWRSPPRASCSSARAAGRT